MHEMSISLSASLQAYSYILDMKLLLPLLLTLFAFGECQSQVTYVYKYHDFDGGSVYELMNDSDMILQVILDPSVPAFADIAIGPDEALYGLSQGGEIHKIYFATGFTEVVGAYADFSAHTSFTIDSDFNCYTLDFFFNLISLNVLTQEETLLANLGKLSPGDLSFYDGRLVFPSGLGVIQSVDPETYDLSPIYTLDPEMNTMADIWGIANSFHECGDEDLIISNTFNELFRIDVDNDSFETLDLTYDLDNGGTIYGMTSSDDLLSSDCNRIVSTESLLQEVTRVAAYPNPTHDFIEIKSAHGVLQIDVLDMNQTVVLSESKPSTTLDLRQLSSGVYFLRVSYADKQELVRIAKF